MKHFFPLLLLFTTTLYASDYTVYGPQGGLSMTVTLRTISMCKKILVRW